MTVSIHEPKTGALGKAIALLLGALIAFAVQRQLADVVHIKPPDFRLLADDYENLSAVYHLRRWRVFTTTLREPGLDGTSSSGYALSSRNFWREPAFPALVATLLTLPEDVTRYATFDRFRSDERVITRVFLVQWSTYVLLVLSTGLAAFWLWRSPILGAGAALLVALSGSLTSYIFSIRPELLASLAVLAIAVLSFSFARRPTLPLSAVLGLSLSALVLTKAAFMFFVPILAAFFAVTFLRKGWRYRHVGALLATLLVCYGVPVLAWMARNESCCGQFRVTDRGGHVLYAGVSYHLRAVSEGLGAYHFFAKDKPLRRLAYAVMSAESRRGLAEVEERLGYLTPGGHWARGLDEMLAIRHLVASAPEAGLTVDAQVESATREAALAKLVSNVPAYLLSLPLFAWRGHFVEPQIKIAGLFRSDWPLFSAFYFFSLLSLFVLALKAGSTAHVAFCLPALFLFSFHTSLTPNETRFNEPLIPVLVIAALGWVKLAREGSCRFLAGTETA